MSDVLASMYPSAAPATAVPAATAAPQAPAAPAGSQTAANPAPAPAAAESPGNAHENAAAKLYQGGRMVGQDGKLVLEKPAEAAPAPQVAQEGQPRAEGEPGEVVVPPEYEVPADYVPTTGPVAWGEDAATPADITALMDEMIPRAENMTQPELREREAFATTLAAVAGPTIGREIIGDMTRAAEAPVTISAEVARMALTRAWGDAAPAKIAAAQGLIDQAEASFPGVKEFLNRTGLGNHPGFIAKVAARAAALSRRK